MVSKYLLIPAILSAALLLGADSNAFAGHGGGGHGGGGHGGGGHGGYGGYGRGYGGFGYGYGGFGYGYGLGLWGYPYYGGYYGGGYYPYYDYPYSYSYAAPLYPTPLAAATPTTPPVTSYYTAPPPMAYSGKTSGPVAASIHVVLPDPQATVYLDSYKTTSTGAERTYQTPPLAQGQSFTYKVRASWMQDGQQVTQERTVSASPGRTTDVVFARTTEGSSTAAAVK